VESSSAVDRIRPVALLGDGLYGQVFVGIDDVLRRQMIVKRVASGSLASLDIRARLIHEARVLSRLDHANLPRVYNYSEQGEHDVFTFEYLEGIQLFEAVKRFDFAKKVHAATAIASALSVAHRNGIVHGALSPDSVVIAKDGEIKVVDFHSTSTNVDGARGDARWRSPEELRGAEPARESDMYRFGLLLQELFGMRDHDARALVAALLCEAPSDRLTAAAALDRLERLGRRRARRIRIAAIAFVAALFTLGGTKFTLDLQREHAAALAAQAEAEARRKQAHALVAFMIENLHPKLLSVGKLDIMEATSNKAFDYFASMDPERISPAEAAVNVQALAQFSSAQLLKNHVSAAENAARKAIALADAVLRKHPHDLALLYARATAHGDCGSALGRKGDMQQAFVHTKAFASACTDLVRREPDDTRFLRSQAMAFAALGNMYGRTGEMEASFRNLDFSVASLRHLLEREPSVAARMQLFDAGRFAGTALIKLGRFREARQRLESTRAEIESVLKLEPSNKELLNIRAGYDDQLVAVALATGDLDAARRYDETQLETSKQLVAFDPARFRWARLLVLAHRSAGTIARMDGDVQAALHHHQASIEAASVVIARAPEQQVTLPRENAWSRMELARSLLAAGQPRQALLHAGLAVEVLRAMPDDLIARGLLPEALLVRGEALAAHGEPVAANSAWEEALRAVELVRSRPPEPQLVDTHARVLLRLGRLDRATPRIEQLAALGYRNREFEALCREKGAITNPSEREIHHVGRSKRENRRTAPAASKTRPG
jgi:tetratricopeptide (TPR) repeat protein/predicted Ser/Thr protein kinase